MPDILTSSLSKINFHNLRWKILDCLYPPFCCSCGRLGDEICPGCFSKIQTTTNIQSCIICGDLVTQFKSCPNCLQESPAFRQLRSWGIYRGVLKDAIHRLKFENGLGIIHILEDAVAQFINGWSIKPDLIMPVPLSPERIRSRGYNQSAWIAGMIARQLNIKYNDQSLIRVRDTHSQTGLNAAQRKRNLANAFKAVKEKCMGKMILLVDDIATTGTTLNECAKAICQAGANGVYCFTLARTLGFTQFEGKVN